MEDFGGFQIDHAVEPSALQLNAMLVHWRCLIAAERQKPHQPRTDDVVGGSSLGSSGTKEAELARGAGVDQPLLGRVQLAFLAIGQKSDSERPKARLGRGGAA